VRYVPKMERDPQHRAAHETIDEFHRLWYHSGAWMKNYFLGHQIFQCPFDMQVYHQLVVKLRPRYILQTGISLGGSALFFAAQLDLIQADPSAIFVGIDIALTPEARALKHPRIHLIEGSSTDARTVEAVKALVPDGGGMVSLDSDHTRDHVLAELRIYRDFVADGSFLVVEDTNINNHPVFPEHGPGPREAMESFLGEDPRFIQDHVVWRHHLFTQHGWLKRST
jgi:cephalosporin hydroxylase